MDVKEVKLKFYPKEYVEALREELNKANACRVGNYDNCISVSKLKDIGGH